MICTSSQSFHSSTTSRELRRWKTHISCLSTSPEERQVAVQNQLGSKLRIHPVREQEKVVKGGTRNILLDLIDILAQSEFEGSGRAARLGGVD